MTSVTERAAERVRAGVRQNTSVRSSARECVYAVNGVCATTILQFKTTILLYALDDDAWRIAFLFIRRVRTSETRYRHKNVYTERITAYQSDTAGEDLAASKIGFHARNNNNTVGTRPLQQHGL